MTSYVILQAAPPLEVFYCVPITEPTPTPSEERDWDVEYQIYLYDHLGRYGY